MKDDEENLDYVSPDAKNREVPCREPIYSSVAKIKKGESVITTLVHTKKKRSKEKEQTAATNHLASEASENAHITFKLPF